MTHCLDQVRLKVCLGGTVAHMLIEVGRLSVNVSSWALDCVKGEIKLSVSIHAFILSLLLTEHVT